MQVWGAGVYTKGSIATSQTLKATSYDKLGKFGDKGALESGSSENNNGNRRVFGSWVEYEAIALGNIRGFGSGAAFGYERNNGGKSGGVSKGTDLSATPGGYQSALFDGSAAFAKSCKFNKETIANDDCSNLGNSRIDVKDSITTRLLSRYSQNPAPAEAKKTGAINPANITYRLGGAIGPRYVKVTGNSSISAYCMPGGGTNNNTLVIDVQGTLTITGNLTYGRGSGANCTAETYQNIAALPQIIIIAEEIRIEPSVTNIDAWLVAGYNGGSGTINTCYYRDPYSNDLKDIGILNADECNKQLVVNGPVFAKELKLNRTYGAGSELLPDIGQSPNPKSIDSAEIFNLRPDTQLWAYNQAQRFSQAVTTYTRELAPRY